MLLGLLRVLNHLRKGHEIVTVWNVDLLRFRETYGLFDKHPDYW